MSSLSANTAIDASDRWSLACTAVLELGEEPVKDVEWAQRVEDQFVSIHAMFP